MIRLIALKELRLLFASPLAWVVLAFLQGFFAWVFLSQLQSWLELQAQIAAQPGAPGVTEWVVAPLFATATIVLLMVVPLLSMRMVAEERRAQTLPFLMSSPVSITQIVLGKYLALLLFLALAVGLIVIMAFSLFAAGRLDLGLLAANALGLLLMGGSFAAVGLYLSCLTAQPLVAAVGTFAVLLGLWLINISTRDPDSLLHMLSLMRHFENFAKGIVALPDLAYYLVLIALFLFLSIRRLDGDQLRA
ncbi:MAG: ABC transporter permease [Burkholderiales bacterium]|nr:ABC transporter permease [Burkholderiales bacterium]